MEGILVNICACDGPHTCDGPSRDDAIRLLRRCAIELCYIQNVENCDSGLCATTEGEACIREAEKLLGPMRDWPEVRE